VESVDLELAIKIAWERGDGYLVMALCRYTAYLTVSWPTEMRAHTCQNIKPEGIEVVAHFQKLILLDALK
jgi:hypothetical protein